jgi:polysaccharide export outer membrane protein
MGILIGLLALALQAGGSGDDHLTAAPSPPPCSAATSAAPSSGGQAFGEREYRLGPEDVISVFVWKQPDLSTTVVIRPDRKISLPLLGEVEAAGKTATQLQTELAASLHQFVNDPRVNIIVKEVNFPAVTVLGQVRKPDRYHIRQRVTALEAIAMAGGFTEFAKRDRVTIIRNSDPEKTRIQMDLKKVVNGNGDVYYLEPLDTIYVQ